MKMNQTFNQHVVKKRNKSLLLHCIKETFPVSRAELANNTGLNKGTVSSLVNELIDEQLILESGPGLSSGGRRPVMLLFNQTAGYTIGVDIGVNYVLAILTDLQGNISNEKLVETLNLSFEETTERIFTLIDELIVTMPESPYGVVGIGIGVPAAVNTEEEIILAPNLKWKNKNLKKVIEEKYKIPVKIKNEANAGAYGEKKFGVGKEFENIVYISGGIGIGVGLILNGKLYKGNNGFSGELGHMTINMNGPICNCGNKGCWELYASEKALVEMVRQYGIPMKSDQELSLEFITKLARNGDPKIIELIGKLAEHLAIGINNIINTFNPEQVIIGNRLVSLQSWLDEPLRESMKKNALTTHQKDLQIHFSRLESRSAALGVAAFSAEKFLTMNLEEA
ncbi:ROK family transcriptional regulator [Halalkalibacter alkaliphilus]|uniref:ROK family transcriptional regulator n=1 Tax=Halalkalibacter alkaliphilus TaxID=2917993 RepID=A0A9X2CX61_9BACI|nr:ROK family transcriptional regulator [Halalkalibacter alkaliphilus]MCL7749675.1 ROK family transcriptional regulator [Halalkalibacter alkaliphilus]